MNLQLVVQAIVYSPVRKVGEQWPERLQWHFSTGGFGFHSPLTREQGERALNYLVGYAEQGTTEQLATSVVWGLVTNSRKRPETVPPGNRGQKSNP